MKISEYQTFLIAPFNTQHYFEAGQFESLDDKKFRLYLKEFEMQLKEFDTSVDDCSKASFTEQFNDIYPDSNKYMRHITLLKIELQNYCLNSPTDIKFENNTIYLYESGTGVILTQVSIVAHDKTSSLPIKKIERTITEKFKEHFLPIIKTIMQKFDLFLKDTGLKEIRLHTNETTDKNLAWIHCIYFVWGDEYFKKKMGPMGLELKDEIKREFSDLLDQVPEDMSPLPDSYVFYGWGKSLIVIKNSNNTEQFDAIKRIVFLMQVIQNISLALYQLESILNERIYKIEPEEVNLQKQYNIYTRFSDITKEKVDIQQITSSTFKFLEQFHYSSNILIQNSERLLLEKLETQWKIGELKSSIRNKLNLLDSQLTERGQTLLSEEQYASMIKQDSLNKLFLWISLVSIVGLLSQLVILDPIYNTLEHKGFFPSPLFVTIIFSGIIIIVLFTYYSISFRNTLSRVNLFRGGRKK